MRFTCPVCKRYAVVKVEARDSYNTTDPNFSIICDSCADNTKAAENEARRFYGLPVYGAAPIQAPLGVRASPYDFTPETMGSPRDEPPHMVSTQEGREPMTNELPIVAQLIQANYGHEPDIHDRAAELIEKLAEALTPFSQLSLKAGLITMAQIESAKETLELARKA